VATGFNISQDLGSNLSLTIDFDAENEQTSTGEATPAYPSSADPFNYTQTVISIDGSATTNFTSFSLDGDLGMDVSRRFLNGSATKAQPKRSSRCPPTPAPSPPSSSPWTTTTSSSTGRPSRSAPPGTVPPSRAPGPTSSWSNCRWQVHRLHPGGQPRRPHRHRPPVHRVGRRLLGCGDHELHLAPTRASSGQAQGAHPGGGIRTLARSLRTSPGGQGHRTDEDEGRLQGRRREDRPLRQGDAVPVGATGRPPGVHQGRRHQEPGRIIKAGTPTRVPYAWPSTVAGTSSPPASGPRPPSTCRRSRSPRRGRRWSTSTSRPWTRSPRSSEAKHGVSRVYGRQEVGDK
jgi:hypothetical protein